MSQTQNKSDTTTADMTVFQSINPHGSDFPDFDTAVAVTLPRMRRILVGNVWWSRLNQKTDDNIPMHFLKGDLWGQAQDEICNMESIGDAASSLLVQGFRQIYDSVKSVGGTAEELMENLWETDRGVWYDPDGQMMMGVDIPYTQAYLEAKTQGSEIPSVSVIRAKNKRDNKYEMWSLTCPVPTIRFRGSIVDSYGLSRPSEVNMAFLAGERARTSELIDNLVSSIMDTICHAPDRVPRWISRNCDNDEKSERSEDLKNVSLKGSTDWKARAYSLEPCLRNYLEQEFRKINDARTEGELGGQGIVQKVRFLPSFPDSLLLKSTAVSASMGHECADGHESTVASAGSEWPSKLTFRLHGPNGFFDNLTEPHSVDLATLSGVSNSTTVSDINVTHI